MDVRQIYRDAQADLRRYETELAILQQKVTGLKKVVDGLLVLDPSVGAGDSAGTTEADAAPPTSRRAELHRDGGPAILLSGNHRKAILSVLATAQAFMSSQEIVDAMVLGNYIADDAEAAEAVRKVVSRMAKAGLLARQPRDGRSFNYGLPGWAVQNAESPALTGLSVVPAPTSDEGRAADVEGSGDRDDHPARWNDSDGRGAPSVMEG